MAAQVSPNCYFLCYFIYLVLNNEYASIFFVVHLGDFRSSHQMCSIKKAVLKNFAIFTGKDLCWNLSFIRLQAFRPATLLKRDSNRCFTVNIAKFLRTAFLIEHLRWLLLKYARIFCYIWETCSHFTDLTSKIDELVLDIINLFDFGLRVEKFP